MLNIFLLHFSHTEFYSAFLLSNKILKDTDIVLIVIFNHIESCSLRVLIFVSLSHMHSNSFYHIDFGDCLKCFMNKIRETNKDISFINAMNIIYYF